MRLVPALDGRWSLTSINGKPPVGVLEALSSLSAQIRTRVRRFDRAITQLSRPIRQADALLTGA
jgi:hypothetical protein